MTDTSSDPIIPFAGDPALCADSCCKLAEDRQAGATFVNPLSRNRPGLGGAARAIKSWVRTALRLGDDAVVSVSELACHVPGCPPRETVILIMQGDQTAQMSIHKALPDVQESDVVGPGLALGSGDDCEG